jgi:hypothetical protein
MTPSTTTTGRTGGGEGRYDAGGGEMRRCRGVVIYMAGSSTVVDALQGTKATYEDDHRGNGRMDLHVNHPYS